MLMLLVPWGQGCQPEDSPTDAAWYCYRETQCADPWRSGPGDLEAQVSAHLDSAGVEVLAFRLVDEPDSAAFCLACVCASGRRIEVKVPTTDRATIEQLDSYPDGGWTACTEE